VSLAIIAMSGGVDSSVSAFLTKQEGYDIIGATMILCSDKDVIYAKNVCDNMGVEHFVLNYRNEFQAKVIDKFVNTYKQGETPSPCIDCNKHMKFEKMIEFAKKKNAEKVVTGHYAIVEKQGNKYYLKKAKDKTKDQTYFLYFLNQNTLPYVSFPLGGLDKSETRKIAEEQGFANHKKPDSQDICFISDGKLREFLERKIRLTSGNFINEDNSIIAPHSGTEIYTIGQRKGLGVSNSTPLYVKEKRDNDIVLCDNDSLYSKRLEACDFSLVCDEILDGAMVMAKIRSTGAVQKARFNLIDDSRFMLEFEEPQRAVAKGQAVVLYDGDYCIGGGAIC